VNSTFLHIHTHTHTHVHTHMHIHHMHAHIHTYVHTHWITAGLLPVELGLSDVTSNRFRVPMVCMHNLLQIKGCLIFSTVRQSQCLDLNTEQKYATLDSKLTYLLAHGRVDGRVSRLIRGANPQPGLSLFQLCQWTVFKESSQVMSLKK